MHVHHAHKRRGGTLPPLEEEHRHERSATPLPTLTGFVPEPVSTSEGAGCYSLRKWFSFSNFLRGNVYLADFSFWHTSGFHLRPFYHRHMLYIYTHAWTLYILHDLSMQYRQHMCTCSMHALTVYTFAFHMEPGVTVPVQNTIAAGYEWVRKIWQNQRVVIHKMLT